MPLSFSPIVYHDVLNVRHILDGDAISAFYGFRIIFAWHLWAYDAMIIATRLGGATLDKILPHSCIVLGVRRWGGLNA